MERISESCQKKRTPQWDQKASTGSQVLSCINYRPIPRYILCWSSSQWGPSETKQTKAEFILQHFEHYLAPVGENNDSDDDDNDSDDDGNDPIFCILRPSSQQDWRRSRRGPGFPGLFSVSFLWRMIKFFFTESYLYYVNFYLQGRKSTNGKLKISNFQYSLQKRSAHLREEVRLDFWMFHFKLVQFQFGDEMLWIVFEISYLMPAAWGDLSKWRKYNYDEH